MSWQNIDFSKEELARYNRHIIIPDFGTEGQKKLKAAKVLVVGSGGLGSPLLLYLGAAGVGTIGIVDFDRVDASNLQRQVLFDDRDIGKLKVEAARERIKALNPYIKVITHNTQLTSDNALKIIRDYDLVADGTDNFPTRYLVNDACVLLDKPNVYASIFQFEGQVSVFNLKYADGTPGPNYRCLYPEPPPPGLVPSCAEGGVLGVLPGIVGSIQANEVIKVVTGMGEPLFGRLFIFDALSFETRTLKFKHDPNNPLNGENPTINELIDYEEFCGVTNGHAEEETLKEITVQELKRKLENNEDFQLIDVREPFEYEIANLGGELIPLGELNTKLDKVATDKEVIVHCRTDGRSRRAVQELKSKLKSDNFYVLKGGVIAYADEIDPKLQKY